MPSPSFAVRFRPVGPWRFGPESGARDRAGRVYHSDAVFSAVTAAMARLDLLDPWLDATARRERSESAVRFSSFFPFQRDLLFVIPPRSVWPPPPSAKVRYKSARFIPLSLVESLLAEQPLDDDRWMVDGESECLLPADRPHTGPFRLTLRSNATVDRLDCGKIDVHSTACLEFTRDSGLWTLVVFANEDDREKWETPVRSAFRLLADSGFGGERSRGWGRSQDPEWQPSPASPSQTPESAWWLLSVYTASERDGIDWKRGSYSTVLRSGRIESPDHWGQPKPETRMLAEGSVLLAAAEAGPTGQATDIAPPGFPHPVFRAGFAVAWPIPWRPSS
jgi:CRISPR type III-A-associated RAMP protein Csm4